MNMKRERGVNSFLIILQKKDPKIESNRENTKKNFKLLYATNGKREKHIRREMLSKLLHSGKELAFVGRSHRSGTPTDKQSLYTTCPGRRNCLVFLICVHVY